MFAPERGANAGASGFGWFVDMEVDFLGMNLHEAGFSGLQLTGPGVHNNAPPFPGAFSTGHAEHDAGAPGKVEKPTVGNAGAAASLRPPASWRSGCEQDPAADGAVLCAAVCLGGLGQRSFCRLSG